jgi:hypothetical protein
MFIAIENARFEKLFERHGGTIIGHEVIRRQKNPLPIITYLRLLTSAVLNLEEGSITDELRKKYIIAICTALSSIYYKQVRWRLFLRDNSEIQEPLIEDDLPAALAAVGKTQLLLNKYANNPKGLLASCSCLPSPLEAAAACEQATLVRKILEMMPERDIAGDRNRATPSAFLAAMRTCAPEAGNLLLQNLFLHPRHAMGNARLLKESVKHADIGFVYRVLQERARKDPKSGLTTQEIRHVLKEATPSVLRTLLSHNYMDANYLGDTTPLTLAIQNHRYDLARVLLQHGANIDGVPATGKLVTALWHAAKMGFRGYGDNRLPGIRFLLQHDADPDIHGDWRSPLRAAEGWVDAQFLLKLAQKRRKDAALHPDLWREFGKPATLEFLKNSSATWTYGTDTVCLSD